MLGFVGVDAGTCSLDDSNATEACSCSNNCIGSTVDGEDAVALRVAHICKACWVFLQCADAKAVYQWKRHNKLLQVTFADVDAVAVPTCYHYTINQTPELMGMLMTTREP